MIEWNEGSMSVQWVWRSHKYDASYLHGQLSSWASSDLITSHATTHMRYNSLN